MNIYETLKKLFYCNKESYIYLILWSSVVTLGITKFKIQKTAYFSHAVYLCVLHYYYNNSHCFPIQY
jgi:hypothetical protein